VKREARTRLGHGYKPLAAHADQPGNKSRPAAAEFVPGHGTVVGKVNILRIESVCNHPVASRKINPIEEPTAANAQHDDHRPSLGQFGVQGLFAGNLAKENTLAATDPRDAAAARAEKATHVVRRAGVFNGRHDPVRPVPRWRQLAMKREEGGRRGLAAVGPYQGPVVIAEFKDRLQPLKASEGGIARGNHAGHDWSPIASAAPVGMFAVRCPHSRPFGSWWKCGNSILSN